MGDDALPTADTRAAAAAAAAGQLRFLDGMRGLAALFVVAHHAYFEVNGRQDGGGLPAAVVRLVNFLAYGHFAVGVFIVLSGFCLALPVATDPARALRGGAIGFLRRRARRILPPYYAALGLSLLLIWALPPLRDAAGGRWGDALPALSSGPVLSHLLLVHNLDANWVYKINPPMWSVATEWQIYFALPLLLLPLWRRVGVRFAVAVAFVAGMALASLKPGLSDACFWYLGLFALGMAAAAHHAARQSLPLQSRCNQYWGTFAAACAAGVVALVYLPGGWWGRHVWLVDPLIGLATAGLILHCAAGPRGAARRLLESPRLTALGGFSYSLYLTHSPTLALTRWSFARLGLGPLTMLAAMLFAAVPVAVVVAYGFHVLFERPFLKSARPASPRLVRRIVQVPVPFALVRAGLRPRARLSS